MIDHNKTYYEKREIYSRQDAEMFYLILAGLCLAAIAGFISLWVIEAEATELPAYVELKPIGAPCTTKLDIEEGTCDLELHDGIKDKRIKTHRREMVKMNWRGKPI